MKKLMFTLIVTIAAVGDAVGFVRHHRGGCYSAGDGGPTWSAGVPAAAK